MKGERKRYARSCMNGFCLVTSPLLSFEIFKRRNCWLAISMLMWIAGSVPAVAQAMLTIPPGEFGRAYIPPPQSTSFENYESLSNPANPNYEPVSRFLAPHPVQKASLDVVRVDLQLKNGKQEACSGILITEKYLLTAAHCFYSANGDLHELAAVQLRRSFFGAEVDHGEGTVLKAILPPVEHDVSVDYAIIALAEPIAGIFDRPKIRKQPIQPSLNLAIIHHPLAQPMRVTRRDCLMVDTKAFSPSEVRHRCDTLPGSSGAPIYDEISFELLGIHTQGYPASLDKSSFNSGVPIIKILQASKIAAEVWSDVAASQRPANELDVQLRPLEARTEPQTSLRATKQSVSFARYLICPAGKPDCQLEPGVDFKDCATCPVMRVVPPGQSVMGSILPDVSRYGNPNETPQRLVGVLRAFAVGKFPITVEEFAIFVKDAQYIAEKSCNVMTNFQWGIRPDKSWEDPGFLQSGLDPVTCVNWKDAKAYVNWLATKTGQKYRLLSEAEWEYSARGQTTAQYFAFPFDPSNACSFSNFADRSFLHASGSDDPQRCNDGYVFTSRVGSFLPNAFGLHDTAGNVLQWVEDCYFKEHDDRKRDTAARVLSECATHVLRGGSWDYALRGLRSAFRRIGGTLTRKSEYGIRVALDLNP